MKLKELKDKKILILGFGLEGRDSLLFLRKLFPKKALGIADQSKSLSVRSSTSNKLYLGKNYLRAIKDYDVVIKSPGIPFKNIPRTVLGKIITQTELFLDNCPSKIIGITGTKGKSTTAYFIYQTLKKAGITAHLVGNIGKPVLLSMLNAKKDDVFVYEMSSHQLYSVKKSPHIAVLLNIYPEHLDYYKSFQEYVRAKANITKYQTKKDYLIFNSQDKMVKKIAQKSKARKIPIQGKYYELNIESAKAVAKIFNVPSLKKFKRLQHRLEFVGKFKGIEFYNDSLSTIPETTIEALDNLGNKVQTLILGGFDRGLSLKKLAERIKGSNVQTVILFPDTGTRMWQGIQSKKIKHFFVKDMRRAVELSYKHTDKGKICILSPASPSFNLFKDYKERGDSFKGFVKRYK